MDFIINKGSTRKNIFFNSRELEKKYHMLNDTIKYGQELAKICFWIYERQCDQVYWTEEIYNLLEGGHEYLNEIFESYLSFVHPDDLEIVKEAILNVKQMKEFDIEYRVVTAKKRVKYVHEKTKVILDEYNNPIKIVGIIQDITEQKLRENNLKEIGDHLNKAQRIAGIGSWKYDVEKDEFYGTDEMFKIYGISHSEFKNDFKNAIQLIHPDDRNKIQEALKKHLQGQSCTIEYRIPQKDGSNKYVISNAEPIFNSEGRVTGVVGTIQDITEKKLLEEKLIKSYKSLVEAERLTKTGSWELDLANKKVVFCSDEIYKIYGISKGQLELDNRIFMNYIHPEDRAIMENIYKNPPSEQPIHVEFRVIRPDGSIFYAYNIMEIEFDKNGKPTFMRGITQDITEKKKLQMEAELKQEKINKMEKKFNALIKESLEVFEILDKEGRIEYISKASERITGYKIEERLGRKIFEFYRESEVQKLNEMMDFVLKNPEEKIIKDILFKTKDGREIYLEFCMQNFLNDPAIEGIVVNFRDITNRVKAEKKIIHLSTHDQLTGLPNKIYFENKIDTLIESADKNNTGFAIFMLDIDNLMYIKNTLGYKVVEQYIFQIAIRLKVYCGPSKFICRYSSNRFIIIYEGIHTADEYNTFIHGIYKLFSKPLKVDKYDLDVEISIGVSFFNRGEEDKEQLIRRAETATFLAKNEGKNKYKFYSSDLDIQSYKHFILRNDLREAIENNQLKFYYQPMVNLKTNDILAAEVLLRWEHPEWGVVSPVEFISIAEETGYIIKIGKWLIKEVCSLYKKWLDRGLSNIKIAINFSSMQFFETNFVENIKKTIDEYQLDPSFLIMEITENVLIENVEKVIADIKRLRSIGIQIALDDFGTGYSSLAYLNSFDIDILKIDGSFIKNINKDETSTVITRHIIKMAQELKIKLVAEHVETWEQLTFLKGLNCYTGQGYIFSKPVPPEDFEKILIKRRCEPIIVKEVVVREERRKFFRVKFTQALEAGLTILEIKGRKVNVGNTKVLIKNIGPGGLCFISNLRLPIERDIILQFKFQLIGEEIKVNGYTVWTSEIDDNLFEYGVEFILSENERTDLIRVLNQVQIKMKNNILFSDGSFITGTPYSYFKPII